MKAHKVPLVTVNTASMLSGGEGGQPYGAMGDKATDHDRRPEGYCRCRAGGFTERYSNIF
jgi:hypothetical protein